MDVDLSVLRALEREKEISFDLLVGALEQALLVAYERTEGAQPHARVELNRKTGHVTVFAQEIDEAGTVLREWDDTPEGFGRIAATTAKQVILQRLRDAEDEITFGEFLGKEGDVVSGTIQQGRDPARRAGRPRQDRGVCSRVPEQVPGERYEHGSRIKCYVRTGPQRAAGSEVTLSRTHPNLVKKLFALEVPEIADGTVEIAGIAREAGHRSKIAVRSTAPGVNAKGACIGPMGARVRAVMRGAARREDRHRGLVGRPGRIGRACPLARAGQPGRGRRRRSPGGPGDGSRLPALAGDRSGGSERPAGGPADRLADRHSPGQRWPRAARRSPDRAAAGRRRGGARLGERVTRR